MNNMSMRLGLNTTNIFTANGTTDINRSPKMILEFLIPDSGRTVTLPCATYTSITVNWGDGTVLTFTTPLAVSHTYGITLTAKTRTVTISGSMTSFASAGGWVAGSSYLKRCIAFGTSLGLTSLFSAFYTCGNLIQLPNYLPSTITNLSQILTGANNASFDYSPILNWKVNNVTTFYRAFRNTKIDQDMGGLIYSNDLTTMAEMFHTSLMSALNMSKTLIGIANWVKGTLNGKASGLPQTITFGASGRLYDLSDFKGTNTHGVTDNPATTALLALTYLLSRDWTITPAPSAQ